MFLNYQPHLYERDRRKEREERSARLEAILDNSSISSPTQNRRQSVDSASISNESVGKRSNSGSNDRRSSLTPSFMTSPSDYASSKNDVSVTDLPSPSPSLYSGSLLHLFQLRRNKSSGQERSQHNKANPDNVSVKSSSRVSRSSERKSSSTHNKKERTDRSATKWGGRDVMVNTLSPTKVEATIDEGYFKMSASDQPPSPSPSSSHSHFGFHRKASQTPKMQKRPSTSSNDRSSFRTEKGIFQRKSASRSEENLLVPKSVETGRANFLANYDDEDSQEVLTSDDPVYNDNRLTAGLRISISSDVTTTDYHGFDSTVDLSEYPLPVRLGVISASDYIQSECPDLLPASARSSLDLFNSKRSKSPSRHSSLASTSADHQYVDGYYLCTPPPKRSRKKANRKSNASSMANNPSSPTQSTFTRQRTISGSYSLSGQSAIMKDTLSNPNISPSSSSIASFGHPTPLGIYRNGPFMIAQNMPASAEKSYHTSINTTNQVEEREKWQINDYFTSENNRRPGRFGFTQSKRHAYPTGEAPYPFAYGSNTIFAEDLIQAHTEKIFGNSYFSSDQPPKRVLDIGCGDGDWILNMARKWPETEFIGMDLVPIQKPVKHLQKDIQKRVSWIVGNVLQGLPFPDQCFDLIHIRFLNYGIPKHKWSSLLDSVNRVLSPGGDLCILESDVNFFGPARRILKSDLSNLELSYGKTNSPFLETEPNIHRKRDQRDTALEVLWQKLLERNGIDSHPTSFLPVLLEGVKDVRQVNHVGPNHTPILARSYSKKTKKWLDYDYFDTQPQTPNLNATSPMKNERRDQDIEFDTWRAIILAAETERIADARLTLWHEVITQRKQEKYTKEEEATLEPKTSFSLPTSPSLISNLSSNPFEQVRQIEYQLSPELSKSFHSDTSIDTMAKNLSQRWRDYAHFESEVDQWKAEIHAKADIKDLLRMQIPWSITADKFDEWHSVEKQQDTHDKKHLKMQDEEEELSENFFFTGTESVGGSESNSPSPLTASSSTSPSQILSESSLKRSQVLISPVEGVFLHPSRRFASDIERELAIQEQNPDQSENIFMQPDRQEKNIMPLIVANDVESPNFDTPTITSQSNTRFTSILGIKTVLLTSVRKDDKDLISPF